MTDDAALVLVALLAATAGATIAAMAAYLAPLAARSKPQPEAPDVAQRRWEPLEPLRGAWSSIGVLAPPGEALAREVSEAIDCLARYSDWDRADILGALRGLRLLVQRRRGTHQWSVPGAELGRGAVVVSQSLEELVHELAHLVEWKLRGGVDAGHEFWEAAGLRAADVEWRQRCSGALRRAG